MTIWIALVIAFVWLSIVTAVILLLVYRKK